MKKISEETNKNITETFLDNGNDGVVQIRSLDVQPILENNKRLYNQNDGYSPDKGLKRIATIPTIILEIWTKEYHKDQNKGNWFELPKEIQKKIKRRIASRILSTSKEKWWTVSAFYSECDEIRENEDKMFSFKTIDEKLKFLDGINDYVMNLEQKYSDA